MATSYCSIKTLVRGMAMVFANDLQGTRGPVAGGLTKANDGSSSQEPPGAGSFACPQCAVLR
jgi:hypothetical protein